MKKFSIVIMISLMIALFALGSYAAEKMTGTQVFKASDLIGANVKNVQGEDLGKISDLAISSQGQVVFAALSHGGMLGMGSKLIAVPITALKFEESGKIARLDISTEKLATAPNFSKDSWPDMTNTKWTDDTYRFYGVRPHWKESEPMGKERDMMEKKEKYNY